MNKQEPWFLGERAELLAMVALTRLSGVSVRPQPSDSGVDLLVSLPAERGGRVFGVQVKGARTRDAYISREGRLSEAAVKQLNRLAGDSPFPVGVAMFDMSDDSGYFGWLVAPAVSDSGAPHLEYRETVSVAKLTDDELQRIVEDVKHWYDLRALAMAADRP